MAPSVRAPVAERPSRSRLKFREPPLSRSDTIAQARRHLLRGRDIVANQQRLIDGLAAKGHNTDFAGQLLDRFEQTLMLFEYDLARLSRR